MRVQSRGKIPSAITPMPSTGQCSSACRRSFFACTFQAERICRSAMIAVGHSRLVASSHTVRLLPSPSGSIEDPLSADQPIAVSYQRELSASYALHRFMHSRAVYFKPVCTAALCTLPWQLFSAAASIANSTRRSHSFLSTLDNKFPVYLYSINFICVISIRLQRTELIATIANGVQNDSRFPRR